MSLSTTPSLSNSPLALALARLLCPEDPRAMLMASRSLPGEMYYLKKYADLATIRSVASKFLRFRGDPYLLCHSTVAAYIVSILTLDEQLVASSLMRNTAAFDIGNHHYYHLSQSQQYYHHYRSTLPLSLSSLPSPFTTTIHHQHHCQSQQYYHHYRSTLPLSLSSLPSPFTTTIHHQHHYQSQQYNHPYSDDHTHY